MNPDASSPSASFPVARRTVLFTLAGALACLLAAQSLAEDDAPPTEGRKRRLASPARSVVAGSNQFTLGLYRDLAQGEGNRVLSPWSIRVALSMVAAGARGETLDELRTALAFGREGPLVHEGYRTHLAELVAPSYSGGPPLEDLRNASAAWFHDGRTFEPTYRKILTRDYSSDAHSVDFVERPEHARRAINAWVEKQTADRIRDLFPAGSITERTRLVLTSALWFSGEWLHRFRPEATKEAAFHLAGGGTANAPLMHLSATLPHFRDESGTAVLELPYLGSRRSMLLVLPKERDGLSALERGLDRGVLARWLAGLEATRVELTLPRWKFTHRPALRPALEKRGLTRVFTPQADLSGMDGTRELHVQGIEHVATIEVDERGTVASAATGVATGITSIPTLEAKFVADRPFLFLIRDRATDAVLFIGRVADPTAE